MLDASCFVIVSRAEAVAAAAVFPTRHNTLGDSVDQSCPDPSTSIAHSIDLIKGLLENLEPLFGCLRAVMDPVFVYGTREKYARSILVVTLKHSRERERDNRNLIVHLMGPHGRD